MTNEDVLQHNARMMRDLFNRTHAPEVVAERNRRMEKNYFFRQVERIDLDVEEFAL